MSTICALRTWLPAARVRHDPIYHRALADELGKARRGSISAGSSRGLGATANYLPDAGPGNALIDDWVHAIAGCLVMRAASSQRQGARMMRDPIPAAFLFQSASAKSLDRNTFAMELVDGLSVEDGAATLAAFTAASIARSREHFPEEPKLWVICGGGRRNKTLMTMIAGRVDADVAPAEAAGMNGDAIEAEAWAYIAVRALKR